jgi:hypothetical protein
MRFNPQALVALLAVCGFAYSAEPAKKPAAKSVAVAPSKPKMPVVPSMDKRPKLWSLQPLVRPAVPSGPADQNPIDAFAQAMYTAKKVTPLGPADQRTLLRRVYMDLIGIPPTPAEQDAYLSDKSPDAYEKLIDRLLASEQYGVRYGRHWLDVLRYADAEERMYAAPGIHYWRDWVVNAVNSDVPYDQFVRAQLTGYRTTERTTMAAVGRRTPLERRPDDMFALGFLARGAVNRDSKDLGELQISAVETVSTAFLGMTVGCAKCHDHMFDPIRQKDFYAMKALFDPLVIKKQTMATPAELVVYGKQLGDYEKLRVAAEAPVNAFVEPYRAKLYADRVAMLPPDVQAIINKKEKARTAAEQKIADDYFPVLRIDSDKIEEVMTAEDKKTYRELRNKLNQVTGGARRTMVKDLPAFWTVEVDRGLEREKSYILTSGDPERPEKSNPVEPGWPFYNGEMDFREGRVEAFSDWLTAKENPLFARVAVNRLWQWHFGEGLQKSSSDFGLMGGRPASQPLLDWLATEFIARSYSQKAMHKLMLTSNTYRLASSGDKELMKKNLIADPSSRFLWSARLQRLEAEPIWDSILTAAGNLDTTLGGPSFDIETRGPIGGGGGRRGPAMADNNKMNRRGAYIVRGFSTSREVVPNFLQSFDVDDGRAPCPVRTQTVTAPQGLFLMNSPEIEKASTMFADRLKKESAGELTKAVDLGYRIALSRPPSPGEKDNALSYVGTDPNRLKNLAWLLFNLDEFIYVQ